MSLWQETSEGLELHSRTPETGRWVLKWADAIPGLYWKQAEANLFQDHILVPWESWQMALANLVIWFNPVFLKLRSYAIVLN
jgi:hypothetical protein